MAFTQVQASAQLTGTNSVTLTLTATGVGNLLVATVLAPTVTKAFTAPAGWKLAKSVPCAAGHAEQWWLPNCPAGITSVVFTLTGGSGENCRGGISEHQPPAGTAAVVIDATGSAAGLGSWSQPVTAACGNSAGALGVTVWADFFSASVVPGGAVHSVPAGWVQLQAIHNGTPNCWLAAASDSLAAGVQSVATSFPIPTPADTVIAARSQPAAPAVTARSSVLGQPVLAAGVPAAPAALAAAPYATGSRAVIEQGWCAVFVAYRAVVFQPVALPGAENVNVFDLDPTGQAVIAGGDVFGLFKTATANLGDQWQPCDAGLLAPDEQTSIGCVAFSQLEPGTVYALAGKNNTTDDGLLASTDGGVTWVKRSGTALGFKFNSAGSPPRPSGEGQDTDRSVGRLLAQDPASGNMYAATYHGGVMASADHGFTWVPSGLGGIYLRCLILNPDNPAEAWAGAWDDTGTGTNGGVWHTTNIQAGAATVWARVGTFTGTVADLKVLGHGGLQWLYAACPLAGIQRVRVGGNNTWFSLNGSFVDVASSLWVSLDGYVDPATGNHVILAGCSGGVLKTGNASYTTIIQLTVTVPGGVVTYADLTGAKTITIATLTDGSTYWRTLPGLSWHYWLGGSGSVNPHIRVDPNNTQRVYVTGSGGFYRSFDGGNTWQIAVIGMPSFAWFTFALDPNAPSHVVWSGGDMTAFDLTNVADPTTLTPSKLPQQLPAGGKGESHSVCFDPVTSDVYQGSNTGYGQNNGGLVSVRTAGTASTWFDLGYPKALTGSATSTAANCPMGLFAGRDSANHRYVVVVTQGAGVWRATCPDAVITSASVWTWAKTDAAIGTSGQLEQVVPIVADAAGTLYLFDRAKGVYRSTTQGASWTQVWAKTTADKRSGWLAANPASVGEVWASTDDGLYQIAGANTGTVAAGTATLTQIAPATFAGAAGIAFYAGQVYAVAFATAGTPVNRLLTAASPYTSWADAGGDSFSSYASLPKQLVINGSGTAVVNTDTNVAIYGPVTAAVPPVLTISPASLPNGATGVAYTAPNESTAGGPPPTPTR